MPVPNDSGRKLSERRTARWCEHARWWEHAHTMAWMKSGGMRRKGDADWIGKTHVHMLSDSENSICRQFWPERTPKPLGGKFPDCVEVWQSGGQNSPQAADPVDPLTMSHSQPPAWGPPRDEPDSKRQRVERPLSGRGGAARALREGRGLARRRRPDQSACEVLPSRGLPQASSRLLAEPRQGRARHAAGGGPPPIRW